MGWSAKIRIFRTFITCPNTLLLHVVPGVRKPVLWILIASLAQEDDDLSTNQSSICPWNSHRSHTGRLHYRSGCILMQMAFTTVQLPKKLTGEPHQDQPTSGQDYLCTGRLTHSKQQEKVPSKQSPIHYHDLLLLLLLLPDNACLILDPA
jgi:hypothetical protein